MGEQLKNLKCIKQRIISGFFRTINNEFHGFRYYSIADMESRIKSLNEWIRRRIRQIYWKQWKKIKTKHDNLVKLGIDNENAWKWANSRKAYWRIADSHILHKSLTNKYLASVGYDDILERYKVLHSNY